MIICHLFVLKKMPSPACPPMARATIEIDYFFNSNVIFLENADGISTLELGRVGCFCSIQI